MTEDEAQAWIGAGFGSDRLATLRALVSLVVDEASRQNLIAESTLAQLWNRHVVDSAQLVPLAPNVGAWLDIGTGAGFPGLVVAVLRAQPTLLVEPRRRRADFLVNAARTLGLDHVDVRAAKVESVAEPAAIVSARAVAPVEKLLHAAAGCATTTTRWLLPRGRLAESELAALRARWSGMFHVQQSVTDPESSVLVLDGVQRR